MLDRPERDRLKEMAWEIMTGSRDFARAGRVRASGFIHARPIVATMMGIRAGLLMGILYGLRKKPNRPGGTLRSPGSSRKVPGKKRKTSRF